MTRFAWLCLAAISVVGTAGAEDVTSHSANDQAPAIVTIDSLSPDIVRGQCPDGNCPSCQQAKTCNNDGCKSCQNNACPSCNNGGHTCNRNKCNNPNCKSCRGHNGSCPSCGNGKGGGFFSCLKAKFGYFQPTGNCGRGMPMFGKYHLLYAAQPGYTDSRDGYKYAAPGYGTPVTVPLAPNVRHSYNYGWGLPSSRLTPMRQGVAVGQPEPVAYHAPIWRY